MPKKWVPEKRHIVGTRPDLPDSVVKSAGRALQILELFDEIRREANVIEICATLGYPQSSTSALLRSLVLIGFLHYDRFSRTYIPTDRVALLGSWINDRLFHRGQVVRMMQWLNEQTGHAVLLCARNGYYAKYIHVIQATNLARLHITLGTERLLATSGTGYAILSTYSDAEVRKIVRAINAYAMEPDNVVNITDLLTTLAEVRELGYTFKPDIVTKGGAVIAMPLPTGNQVQPLVLGVGGVSDILRESEGELVGLMREAMEQFLSPEAENQAKQAG